MINILTPDSQHTIDLVAYKRSLVSCRPGSRVMMLTQDPARLAECLIGNWESNLVSVPVDPRLPESVIDYIKKDCEPHAIVTDSGIELADSRELSPTEDYGIFYTSGTTGRPKGVVQTRSGLEHNARAVAHLHGFKTGTTHVTALPLFHCNAAAMSLFGNYFLGGTAVFLAKFTPQAFFEACQRYRAETANVVPPFVLDLAASGLSWPTDLKYVLSAAMALNQEVSKAFYQTYGARLRQGYGLSESVNFSFTMPVLDDDDYRREMVESYPPVGHAIPGTEFRIKDGEVQVRSPSVMRCYWRNAQATQEAFDDDWLRTGDLGELRGDYLVLIGRKKELINRGGEKFSPVMIEDEYRRAGLAGDFAVVACQDDRLGESLALVMDINIESVPENLPPKLSPSVMVYGQVQRTATRKPQRASMGRGLFSVSHPESGYSDSMRHAGRIAAGILDLGPARDAQQQYILDVAEKLAAFAGPGRAYPTLAPYLDAIENNMERFWTGEISGHDIIRIPGKDHWIRLMCDYPMGEYPRMVERFMTQHDMWNKSILEVGAGIGNFTRLAKKHQPENYLRTDIKKSFLSGDFGFPERPLDLNRPFDLPEPVDCVVGVNTFHCANPAALRHAYDSLVYGGYLVMGEGNPWPTHDQHVWAMDLKCGFIDGWWDQGGFRDRATWLADLKSAGFREIGFSVFRESNHDLGGLIWARK